ncbi:MAG: prepilin-type N-terminal cleavage/methylation domain-containing protein [Candidatus Omnitrophica bacterium]|nr:prepilin-type N-terminal cleavage/methylation domain-containing protein [Candidatus Omnitrophota bacterium]
MKTKKSFTIIEVLIALAILIIAISSILVTYLSCFMLIDTDKNINIATNAAQALMEEIRSTPFTEIMNDYNGLNFTINDIPESMGVVYVDDTNPELLQITISACFRHRGRVIGEDSNLNGNLDVGEDVNGNGIIDSPVELTTRIANR